MNSERQSHYLLKNMRGVRPTNINPPITSNKYVTRGVRPTNITLTYTRINTVLTRGVWSARHHPHLHMQILTSILRS